MRENLNLIEILKDCPKGTKLYCPLIGEVIFQRIGENKSYKIVTCTPDELGNIQLFTKEGKYYDNKDGECLLFPSKDQRDWSKFKTPWLKKPKFDPTTLMPFDTVLRRCKNIDMVWSCDFFSHLKNRIYVCSGCISDYVIPYNEETKHLVGTTEEAPEYYRYWEE